MNKSTAVVIPIRPARPAGSRKLDLALTLAMLGKAVRAHHRARRLALALLARSAFRHLDGYPDAKSLGA